MLMYQLLDDDIRSLIKETTPWIIGSKGSKENFEPIFKENTPADIIEKYQKLKFLIKNRQL